jgi:hypothetical protein
MKANSFSSSLGVDWSSVLACIQTCVVLLRMFGCLIDSYVVLQSTQSRHNSALASTPNWISLDNAGLYKPMGTHTHKILIPVPVLET